MEQRQEPEGEQDNADVVNVSCGWRKLRPGFLQRFASAKWFLFFQCWLVLGQGMIVSGFAGVVISSLEKRFSLKTSQVGAVNACYDIAAATMAVVVSYYGHHHKPKWLGGGAIILGVGCLLFALPHFLVGRYEPGIGSTNVCTTSSAMSATGSNQTSTEVVKCQSAVWSHIFVFVIAELFIGVGATPVYILGTAYIDENVRHTTSGLFLGIMYAMATFGPAIGYLLGGEFLKIFVDLEQEILEENNKMKEPVERAEIATAARQYTQKQGYDLSPEDSNFIGAWWLGYVFGGVLALLVSLPLLAFPWELPGTSQIRAEKQEHRDTLQDDQAPHTLKQLLPAVKSLLTNKTFIFLALAAGFEGFAVAGYSTFLPKFVESQFRLSAGSASTYTGLVVVPGGIGGMLLGGLLIKKMQWSCDKIIRACFFISVAACLSGVAMLFGCPDREFAGVTQPYFNSSGSKGINAHCNAGCNCDVRFYAPLCSKEDKLTYYSPCYAGCSQIIAQGDADVFSNCSCLLDQSTQATGGRGCIPECKMFIPFMFGLFILMVTTFLNNIPATTATLRCVPESQGSFALGIQQLIVRIIAFIPSPIIFGFAIDTTCRLNQGDPCDPSASRNCLEHSTEKFRYVMVGIGGTFKLLSAVAFYFAWKFYKLPSHEDNIQSPDSQISEVQHLSGNETTEQDMNEGIPQGIPLTRSNFRNGQKSQKFSTVDI